MENRFFEAGPPTLTAAPFWLIINKKHMNPKSTFQVGSDGKALKEANSADLSFKVYKCQVQRACVTASTGCRYSFFAVGGD